MNKSKIKAVQIYGVPSGSQFAVRVVAKNFWTTHLIVANYRHDLKIVGRIRVYREPMAFDFVMRPTLVNGWVPLANLSQQRTQGFCEALEAVLPEQHAKAMLAYYEREESYRLNPGRLVLREHSESVLKMLHRYRGLMVSLRELVPFEFQEDFGRLDVLFDQIAAKEPEAVEAIANMRYVCSELVDLM
jgi:hypothetical protein